jgi:prepilin-type N-terminal cleavage/methylation domain-containing protein
MKNQFFKTHKKGFTLIEMMVSIFIFSFIMVVIGTVFASQFKTYKDTRDIQGDLENAQFALNYVSKTLRTAEMIGYGSSNGSKSDLLDGDQPGASNYDDDFYLKEINPADGGLILYDFVQETCIIFTFRDADYNIAKYKYPALWMESQTGIGINETKRCLDDIYNNISGGEYKNQRLTTGNVSGNFFVAPTRYQDKQNLRNTDTIGRATVSMNVKQIDAQEDDAVKSIKIQSTTSMRDYPSDLSF